MTKITSFFQPKTNTLSKQKRTGDLPEESEIDLATKRFRLDVKHASLQDGTAGAVDDLLASLDDITIGNDPAIVTGKESDEGDCSMKRCMVTWKSALQKHFASQSFANLAKFVNTERCKYTVFPPLLDTWTALNACPLHLVKVVIVGQDPYHGPGQAHGLCFSVPSGQAVPPSLKNIYKELIEDPDVDFPAAAPNHGHLTRWAQQGVLLLNTVMTVRQGEANSHKNRGWESVTDEIIRAVDRRARLDGGRGCVFLLWGKPATAKALQLIEQKNNVAPNNEHTQSSPHTIICTSHPSPLGARKTDKPFLGSRCFSRCNQALMKMGHPPIDWNVDGPIPAL